MLSPDPLGHLRIIGGRKPPFFMGRDNRIEDHHGMLMFRLRFGFKKEDDNLFDFS